MVKLRFGNNIYTTIRAKEEKREETNKKGEESRKEGKNVIERRRENSKRSRKTEIMTSQREELTGSLSKICSRTWRYRRSHIIAKAHAIVVCQ